MEHNIRHNQGWIVIERSDRYSTRGESILAENHSRFSMADILHRYKGIEGIPWPDSDINIGKLVCSGMAPIERYDEVLAYYDLIRNDRRCEIIYIMQYGTAPSDLPDGYTFCGYDYGYYLSEDNYYSIIFNEVIFGRYQALRDYIDTLNDNLLLPSKESVNDLESVRCRLIEEKADLEVDEVPYPIAVYYHKSTYARADWRI